jgi:hypothetical protein
MKKLVSFPLLFCLMSFCGLSQDTLPKFTVRNVGNKHVIISWKNNYPVVKQINIQRSTDTLRNFKTIMSIADPTAKENGFADAKAPDANQFYRLFIALDNGSFVFTDSKKPVLDSIVLTKINEPQSQPQSQLPTQSEPEATTTPLKKDNTKTEKLEFENKNPAVTNREINGNKPNLNVAVQSMHVYTYKDGNVRINLPDDPDKKYSIKFFDQDNSIVFEIKEIKQTPVLLDKANFYHAGWFKFELYEDGKLIEKNKFKIAKDF